MDYVKLGGTNLFVSPFCLGTMMFGGKTSADEATGIVNRAVEAGVNFIDTADMYEEGRSEEIVGRALAQGHLRDRVVLASKGGISVGPGPNDQGASRYHLVRAVEASLKRLGTDRIDLYYIHWPEKAMNLEETLRALDDLTRQGKILYAACSNFPAWLWCRAQWVADRAGTAPLVAGQYHYNLIERGLEVEVLPMAAGLRLGVTAYRPLALGLLTGKYLGAPPTGARGERDPRIGAWQERYGDGVAKLKAFAEARGYTCADAANAWVVSHRAVTSAIVGVSRLEQLEANLRGFEWQMTAAERDEVTGYFPTAVWEESGGKFPDWRRSYDILP